MSKGLNIINVITIMITLVICSYCAYLAYNAVNARANGTSNYLFYTVKFVDFDGTVLQEQEYPAGASLTIPEVADDRTGYTFTGWTPELDMTVNNSLTYTAVYNDLHYTITFYDYDGTVISSTRFLDGDSIVTPTAPVREGYRFIDWVATDSDYSDYTLSYTATYAQLYAVTFYYNNTIIDTAQNCVGDTISFPDVTTTNDPDLYHIEWQNESATIIDTTNYVLDDNFNFYAVDTTTAYTLTIVDEYGPLSGVYKVNAGTNAQSFMTGGYGLYRQSLTTDYDFMQPILDDTTINIDYDMDNYGLVDRYTSRAMTLNADGFWCTTLTDVSPDANNIDAQLMITLRNKSNEKLYTFNIGVQDSRPTIVGNVNPITGKLLNIYSTTATTYEAYRSGLTSSFDITADAQNTIIYDIYPYVSLISGSTRDMTIEWQYPDTSMSYNNGSYEVVEVNCYYIYTTANVYIDVYNLLGNNVYSDYAPASEIDTAFINQLATVNGYTLSGYRVSNTSNNLVDQIDIAEADYNRLYVASYTASINYYVGEEIHTVEANAISSINNITNNITVSWLDYDIQFAGWYADSARTLSLPFWVNQLVDNFASTMYAKITGTININAIAEGNEIPTMLTGNVTYDNYSVVSISNVAIHLSNGTTATIILDTETWSGDYYGDEGATQIAVMWDNGSCGLALNIQCNGDTSIVSIDAITIVVVLNALPGATVSYNS